jgi:hypothetical protein
VWKRACKGLYCNDVAAVDLVVAVLVYVKNQKKQKRGTKVYCSKEDCYIVDSILVSLVSLGKVQYTMHFCTHMILLEFIEVKSASKKRELKRV